MRVRDRGDMMGVRDRGKVMRVRDIMMRTSIQRALISELSHPLVHGPLSVTPRPYALISESSRPSSYPVSLSLSSMAT
jgi:hypothetical protein